MMSLTHVDRPPLGDVATTVLTMAVTNPGIDFRVTLTRRRATALRGSELPGRLPDLVAIKRRCDDGRRGSVPSRRPRRAAPRRCGRRAAPGPSEATCDLRVAVNSSEGEPHD